MTSNNTSQDPSIPELNKNISILISTNKTYIWGEHIEKPWDHRRNTSTYWNTIHGLVLSLQPTQINITTEQVLAAIKNSKNNNSTGPDNINIKHLKNIGKHGLQYLTNIYNAAINDNKIPHVWKLANIIPIPKPNKDINIVTSYRPISLLSVIAKTLEKVILPYITQNIPNITTQHGFKTKHSTNTAIHNINNTVAAGFNQPPTRTIAVALDMSKAFDTVNIHTLIDKLTQTNIPHTILRYSANYIKGRIAYTTFRNHTSTKRQFKSGVPQGGVLSPILFNIYTSDISLPPDSVQLTTYADDITITAPHTDINIAKANIQHYLQDVLKWTKDNDLLHNTDKTTCTLLTPDPAEYNTQLGLQTDNPTVPMTTHPKLLGLTLDPKLTYNRHIDLAATKARKTINILKVLTSTKWGKHKETILATYKTITRPVLEYASTIWSPNASKTNIDKLQIVQNTALRIATGCTHDTNTQHLHDETNVLPIHKHLQLHASQIRQKAPQPTHPLHKLTTHPHTPRLKKNKPHSTTSTTPPT